MDAESAPLGGQRSSATPIPKSKCMRSEKSAICQEFSGASGVIHRALQTLLKVSEQCVNRAEPGCHRS